MTLGEAWTVLGKNPQEIAISIKSTSTIQEKIIAVDTAYIEAKKLAKKLMAQNHPDINPNNPLIVDQFMRVQQALKIIENSTQEFKDQMNKLTNKKQTIVLR